MSAMREQLPTGLPVDNLDRVVAILEKETNSGGLRGKLIDLGWISPSGEALDWWHWWLRREQRWI